MITNAAGALALAYLLDLAIGDPRFIPHPVRFIGASINALEKRLIFFLKIFFREKELFRKQFRRGTVERITGTLLVIIIVVGTWGITFFIINYIAWNSTFFTDILGSLFIVWLISTTLATRELIVSVQSVIQAVKQNNISTARKSLSMIVGRDTGELENRSILAASVETLAENASDGIIAPLFYYMLGGLPLAMAYKAVNTLDSMIGYKNEKYLNFGWPAAKLDDIANYIPARITGLLIAISAVLVKGVAARQALTVMLKDGNKHTSPNSGIPEAAMAGALGVKLGGPATYNGLKIEKPSIGIPCNRLTTSKAETALILTIITSILGFSIVTILLLIRESL